jgi:hypothetical protein
MQGIKVNLGKVSITVHGNWENIDYDKLSLVYSVERNATYISKKPVPKDTALIDTNYWALVVKGNIPQSTIEDIYTKEEIDFLLISSIETTKNYINSKLSDYYTKQEITDTISNYYNKAEIDEKLSSYATKEDLENINTGNIDLSEYVKRTELDIYAKKTDIPEIPKLPNFKTINGESIIGEGNISIGGGGNGGSTPVENNYTPTLDENTKVTTELGSIKAGSTLGELAGKSFSEIVDAMLVNETWSNPNYTHSISMSTPTSLVKVGSSVVVPTYSATWNSNIQSDNEKVITASLSKNILGSSETAYNTAGTSTFTLTYSYPAGYYNITSNLGNTKTVTVPAVSNANITRNVTATYPWFINNTEQALVAIGSSKTIEISLTGSPSIKVPFANSTISIQADLGFGWMDVSWNESVDNSNLGNAIDETVPYKVYTKPDSYASSVKHKITIKLSK